MNLEDQQTYERLLTAVHFTIMDLRLAMTDSAVKESALVRSAYTRLVETYGFDPTDDGAAKPEGVMAAGIAALRNKVAVAMDLDDWESSPDYVKEGLAALDKLCDLVCKGQD